MLYLQAIIVPQSMFEIFLKSILVGFCAAMPLGPIAVLALQKTLSGGWRNGYSVGFGSSFGDTLYAAISVLSIAFISQFLDDHKAWVLVVGGAIVLFIGIGIMLTNPVAEIRQKNQRRKGFFKNRMLQGASQGFLMTLANPGALVLMLGIVAFFKLDIEAAPSYYAGVVSSILGVIIGTNLWWVAFTSLINMFRKKFKLRQLIAINRISGVVIAALGAVSAIQGIIRLMEI